jgi:hypothetical protein
MAVPRFGAERHFADGDIVAREVVGVKRHFYRLRVGGVWEALPPQELLLAAVRHSRGGPRPKIKNF